MSRQAGAVGVLAAIVSWAVMAVTLGNAGLQRIVTGGAIGMWERSPQVALACLAGFTTAFALSRFWRLPRAAAWRVALMLVVLDLAAALAAVVVVGELELSPRDIGASALAVSAYGGQVIAAGLGVWVGGASRGAGDSSGLPR